MNSPSASAIGLTAACLALSACAAGAGGQTGSSGAVTALTVPEARSAMRQAGLSGLTDMTVDPQFPSISARQAEGFVIQTTLYACEPPDELCRGVEVSSVIPATTLTNAEIIEASIEQSAFGIDAVVVEAEFPYGSEARDPQYAVMLSTYLVYDHGVSDTLYLSTLESMLDYITQTKQFMLLDDPAHAELWARKRL